MITPQQIDQISFSKSTFGGYNMQQVDEILEPLTEDYVTLYKENALLKSKMRVIVGKLEEYRKNEAAIKDAAVNAKKTCDKMIQEAEAKAAQMVQQAKAEAAAAATVAAAPASAAAPAVSADALVAAEEARVVEARKAANSRINEIQEQMRSCIQALERMKGAAPVSSTTAAPKAAAPAPVVPVKAEESAQEVPAAPAEKDNSFDSDEIASQISMSLEAMVGTTQDTAPKAPPMHPAHDATTSRFTNLNLQFGRNYDPTH